jgi:hypothetical protein
MSSKIRKVFYIPVKLLKIAVKRKKDAILICKQGAGLPLPSFRCAAIHLPQGDGFCGSGKVVGIAQRRPLGGAGERSEPEGV